MRYVKDFNHELHKIYVDGGYSAKNTNRPALQEMITDIKNKQIDIVIVWRLDRLTRKTRDGLQMIEELFSNNGVTFVSIMERYDLSTAQGKYFFTLSLANAQNERELIGERVTFGSVKKAKTGKRVSMSHLLGYDLIDGELFINEEEAETIKRIFNSYVYQGMGFFNIARDLNNNGFKAKRSNKFYPAAVKRVIQNQTYAGYNIWTPKHGEQIVIKGHHEPIISKDLYNLAQTMHKRKSNFEAARSSHPYPFTAIVKCGDCGGSYSAYGTITKKKGKVYTNTLYICPNKRLSLCKAPGIIKNKLEKLFFDYFDNVHVEAETYIPDPSPQEIKQAQKEKARLEKEINKLEKRKSGMIDLLADGLMSRDEYKTKIIEINESLSNLSVELKKIEPEKPMQERSSEEVIDMIRNLRSEWAFMEDQDKKFIIQMLFKRIVIKKEGKEWRIIDVEIA